MGSLTEGQQGLGVKAKDEELDIGTGNGREKRDGEADRGMQRETER